jgi:hypothetical protein
LPAKLKTQRSGAGSVRITKKQRECSGEWQQPEPSIARVWRYAQTQKKFYIAEPHCGSAEKIKNKLKLICGSVEPRSPKRGSLEHLERDYNTFLFASRQQSQPRQVRE